MSILHTSIKYYARAPSQCRVEKKKKELKYIINIKEEEKMSQKTWFKHMIMDRIVTLSM